MKGRQTGHISSTLPTNDLQTIPKLDLSFISEGVSPLTPEDSPEGNTDTVWTIRKTGLLRF